MTKSVWNFDLNSAPLLEDKLVSYMIFGGKSLSVITACRTDNDSWAVNVDSTAGSLFGIPVAWRNIPRPVVLPASRIRQLSRKAKPE